MRTFKEFAEGRDMTHDMHILYEAGYGRIKRMFWGNVPTITTVGIITAENPNADKPEFTQDDLDAAAEFKAKKRKGKSRMGNKKDPVFHANRRLNGDLYDELRSQNLGPIKIKGTFAKNKENSFLIPNISKKHIIELGRKYQQEAVIWGQKKNDHFKQSYFQFEYINSRKGTTDSVRSVHIASKDVQGKDDFYSLIKGKKFIIPFFDDEHRFSFPSAKTHGEVENLRSPHILGKPGMPEDEETLSRMHRFWPGRLPLPGDRGEKAETFFIPPIDDLQAEWEYGPAQHEISYYSDQLPKDPETLELIEDIQYHAEMLMEEDKLGKWYWHHRCLLNTRMQKLVVN